MSVLLPVSKGKLSLFLCLWPLFSFPFHFSSSKKNLCSPKFLFIESAKCMRSPYLPRTGQKPPNPTSPELELLCFHCHHSRKALLRAATHWSLLLQLLFKAGQYLKSPGAASQWGCSERSCSPPGMLLPLPGRAWRHKVQNENQTGGALGECLVQVETLQGELRLPRRAGILWNELKWQISQFPSFQAKINLSGWLVALSLLVNESFWVKCITPDKEGKKKKD